jgi:hypothetical protein
MRVSAGAIVINNHMHRIHDASTTFAQTRSSVNQTKSLPIRLRYHDIQSWVLQPKSQHLCRPTTLHTTSATIRRNVSATSQWHTELIHSILDRASECTSVLVVVESQTIQPTAIGPLHKHVVIGSDGQAIEQPRIDPNLTSHNTNQLSPLMTTTTTTTTTNTTDWCRFNEINYDIHRWVAQCFVQQHGTSCQEHPRKQTHAIRLSCSMHW